MLCRRERCEGHDADRCAGDGHGGDPAIGATRPSAPSGAGEQAAEGPEPGPRDPVVGIVRSAAGELGIDEPQPAEARVGEERRADVPGGDDPPERDAAMPADEHPRGEDEARQLQNGRPADHHPAREEQPHPSGQEIVRGERQLGRERHPRPPARDGHRRDDECVGRRGPRPGIPAQVGARAGQPTFAGSASNMKNSTATSCSASSALMKARTLRPVISSTAPVKRLAVAAWKATRISRTR